MPIPALPASTDLTGKSILITGASPGGLGYAAALLCLQLGASPVHLAVRTFSKGRAARDSLLSDAVVRQKNPNAQVTVYDLDMERYESVVAFADRFKAEQKDNGLNIAILNAGILRMDWGLAPSGNELGLQVNHLSTALLSLLLLPLLEATSTPAAPSRLTIISSGAHKDVALDTCPPPSVNYLDQLNDKSQFKAMERYGLTKLLIIFFLRELAARVSSDRVIINNVCPGMIRTNIFSKLPFYIRPIAWAMVLFNANDVEAGARTYVHGVSVVGKESHGLWYQMSKQTAYSDFVLSREGGKMQTKVWNETMEKLEKVSSGIGSGL